MKNLSSSLFFSFIILFSGFIFDATIYKDNIMDDFAGLSCLHNMEFQQIIKLVPGTTDVEITQFKKQFELLNAEVDLQYTRNNAGEISSLKIIMQGLSCSSSNFGMGYIILNKDGTGVCSIQGKS